MSENAHFHVAMFGRSEIETFQSDFKYVSIITSPGIAFIVRDPLAELDKTATIMTSLAGCWPAIIIIFLFSVVAGIFVWIAVRFVLMFCWQNMSRGADISVAADAQ